MARLSRDAAEYMQKIGEAFFAAKPRPNYPTWQFDRGADDDVHTELRDLGLLKLNGTMGAPYSLTHAGYDWISEHREDN